LSKKLSAYDDDKVPLTGILAEFRTALIDEIDAARRHESSSAVPLVNGRRIAQIGGNFQYTFEIENLLNLPGDTPADLNVPGFSRQEVSVVAISGMVITISVPTDLGAVVPTAQLQTNLTYLMRKLIERIETAADRPNVVGDRILNPRMVSGEPLQLIFKGQKLNKSQKDAVASSIGRDTTFIWGPPGTGKTQTIGAIGVELFNKECSVLLVSHTNTAVDQATIRIAETLDIDVLTKAKVLRVGDTVDPQFKNDKYKELLLKTHTDRRSKELADQRDKCEAEKKTAIVNVLQLSRDIELCEWVIEAEKDLPEMIQSVNELQNLENQRDQKRQKLRELAARSQDWKVAYEAACYAQVCTAEILKLNNLIAEIQIHLTNEKKKFSTLTQKLKDAKVIYEQTVSVGWLTRRWRGLPSPEEQKALIANIQAELTKQQESLDSIGHRLKESEYKRTKFSNDFAKFRQTYQDEPENVLQLFSEYSSAVHTLESEVKNLSNECALNRLRLEESFKARLCAVREWGLTTEQVTSAESMLSALHAAYDTAVTATAQLNLDELKAERNRLNENIRSLEAQIQMIEETLKRIEEIIISEATVVGTTLTRAYLRDAIQSRRFDTVILDEASMAPIPALWIAASLSIKNAVVVGDPRQLPPIVISDKEMPQKWLGRDIFEVAGLNDVNNQPPYLVELLEQHRMHPEISAIPNHLIYGRRLKDAASTHAVDSDSDLLKWYRHDWGYDNPVLLVDTGPLGAWVTSVSRGTRPSRLNFLSATLCVDLAEQFLKENRCKLSEADKKRILIVCPYRPHAKLLELLVKEQGLHEDVRAGTAHSFQGSEADVVILDLVNDEPHWRVGMFIPENDNDAKRLLNVALTRAKRRLVIVGDFDYIMKMAKKAFVGKELIPFLCHNYPRVDARNVVPFGLAGRAAKAQAKIIGGAIEPQTDRIVVTQERFYSLLLHDLEIAQNRIVIYSAFITQDRLGQLEPQIKAATERGVRVYVITKAHSDRNKNELTLYRMFERTLAAWEVIIVHKRRMHEKLVFIDDNVLWSGSLNPLSFSNTQEIMERRHNKVVVQDFARTLLLDELVGQYTAGMPSCPICGSEIIASEGTDDPFYWTCIEDGCYSRNVNQPPLTDGIIRCANCGGMVEYGEWGGEPVWRCSDNPRHRQRIAHIHLRLPKLRALIPKRELLKLDKLFSAGAHAKLKSTRNNTQMRLFDS